MSDLVDQIYEAAFVPELWVGVLGRLAEISGAQSGALLIIDNRLPPLFTCTPNIRETLETFSRTEHWYKNEPARRLKNMGYPGFLERADFMLGEERAPGSPWNRNMVDIGAAWQIGSVVEMAGGEIALFTFERSSGLPDFSARELGHLDSHRPHLARASLIAGRLMMEKAQERVAAMEALGIPAAIISRSRTVIATNSLFDQLDEVVRPAAFGGVSLKARDADRLIQDGIMQVATGATSEVQTVPVPPTEETGPLVMHIIPLRRAASDIFDGGCAVLAVTGYQMDANTPPERVLRGLFDLSPAEAAIATGLVRGLTLQQISTQRGVSIATARSHLARTFFKTGTSHQAQLVALLKGVSITF